MIGLHAKTACLPCGSRGRAWQGQSADVVYYSAFASSASQLSGDSGPADGFLFRSRKLAVLIEQRIMSREPGRSDGLERTPMLNPPKRGAGASCKS